jgi:FixJ family two-component response regulator
MSQGNVFLVDDDARVRKALTNLLEAQAFSVLSFGSAQEFLRYDRGDAPGCLILDLRLPSVGGLQLQEMMKGDACMPIIFISAYGDIPSTVKAMKAGAVEFLEKPVKSNDLLAAVQVALSLATEKRISLSFKTKLQERYETLTSRERDVLPLVIGGHLNKQAAAILSIAEVTLEVHKRNVLQKMGAPSIAELVRMAARLEIQPKTPGIALSGSNK